MDQVLERVRTYIEENRLIGRGDHVIAGLSGGADSVCLLLLLEKLQKELELTITAVHVHHGIRGASADRDMAFAGKLCSELEIDFMPVWKDVVQTARKNHQTVEEAGRAVRYEVFEQVASERGGSVIAVAHHMDDQAETVLMNLLRGSGLRGCAGIPVQRRGKTARVVRPLLCLRRKEIEQWLRLQGQTWCTDETNQGTDYLRSRVRNCLIPLIEEQYNRQAADHLAAAAGDFREADQYLRERARELMERWKRASEETRVVMPVEGLLLQPPILRRYLIQEGLSRLGGEKDIGRTHIEAALSLLQKTGTKRIMLPGGREARICYQDFILEKKKSASRDEKPKKGEKNRVTFTIFFAGEKKIPQNCCVNWFDYDTIKEGLLMRKRRPGDRICVRADGSTQKLSDYMINARIPAELRDRLLVLASGSNILWVPGYRMAENCKITDRTRLILQVRMESV